jgi:SAM-dependent methyltransferase
MTGAGQLYDALFAFESRFRRGQYPIHKRLQFDDSSINNTYEWVARRFTVPADGVILDAGCGVAFGTLYLASQTNAAVVGISVSDAEVEQACRNVDSSGYGEQVSIRCRSYDNLESGAFDMIVVIESLKHSLDLQKSLRSLVRALKVGGRMIIVEDLYKGNMNHPSATQMAKDWRLAQIFREADYLDSLTTGKVRTFDLTKRVKVTGHASLAASMLGVQTFIKVGPRKYTEALRAFRGGLHLQRLFAGGLMRYKAIEFTRTDGAN